jgi:hypothetical protein
MFTIPQKSLMKSGAVVSLLFGITSMSFVLSANKALALGSCKNVELTFKNGTSQPISIPEDGHRVKNPGGLEGWNKLTLGAGKSNLQANSSWSDTLKLNIKCVTDAEFEIKWSDNNGNHTSVFSSVNISDKQAIFTLK